MQSYILTHYRLRKRELLIALGSHQGEPLICTSAVPHHGDLQQQQQRSNKLQGSHRLSETKIPGLFQDQNMGFQGP